MIVLNLLLVMQVIVSISMQFVYPFWL